MYEFLTDLSRTTKRLIFFLSDFLLFQACLYAAYALRFGTSKPIGYIGDSWLLFPLLVPVYILLVGALRLPSIKLDAFENNAIMRIGGYAFGMALAAMALSYVLNLGTPRSVPLIFGGAVFVASTGTRLLAQFFLQRLHWGDPRTIPVAVYGAGAAGIQLVSALRRSREVRPIVFIDDNAALSGVMVAGLDVKPAKVLAELAAKGRIERVILAMPSVSAHKRDVLLKKLSALPVEVQAVPSYVELLAGKGIEDGVRTVSSDELLGRETVDLSTSEIEESYAGRVVMVTGAGGSIGSELCRQLLNCRPAKIVLFEQSEFALYEIDQDLRPTAAKANIEVATRLGSVTNNLRVREVMKQEGVNVVLHAAAYKHVPIVEDNVLEGAKNNVIGTRIVAQAAVDMGIERFILISTDKAVRPSNIMGATKRLAELVVQDLQTRSPETILSMVRFGNVLGSSGSVIPLFQKQIEKGGPVTVTHPEVTRFFMTIPEAARLVLLAGAHSAGGNLFVLDMGESMKIIDVARRMIALSGRTVKDAENPDGDMEIVITGLRPGEKLYEELLIDEKSLRTTTHEKIMRAEEGKLSQEDVADMLKELLAAVEACDQAALRRMVVARVEGYHQPEKVTC